MIRFSVMALLLAFLALPVHSAEPDYIFILKARGNPYWNAMLQGIEETAKAQDIAASVHQLSNDSAAEEQLNLCEALISKKPKVLAMAAVTSSVGLQCMKAAQAKGIIVADMDSNVSIADAKAAGISLAYTVGSDNVAIGRKAAEHAASLLQDGDKIIILEGAAGSVPGNHRRDGFKDMLATLKPRVSIAASVSADWDRLKANTATADLLLSNPDAKLIYACNDMMGLGAAEAVRAANKGDQIKIIAVDGIEDARKAVLMDRMEATVAQLPYLVGKRAVELAVDAAQNKKTSIEEIVPTPVLTKAAINANSDSLLQYVR